jgi:hypothetical protein
MLNKPKYINFQIEGDSYKQFKDILEEYGKEAELLIISIAG